MWNLVLEIVGWTLTAIGLILLLLVVRFAANRAILEAFAIAFPSAIVFRAGIGLVRLASASRIAQQLRSSRAK